MPIYIKYRIPHHSLVVGQPVSPQILLITASMVWVLAVIHLNLYVSEVGSSTSGKCLWSSSH